MKFGVSIWLWTSPVTNEVIQSFIPRVADMGFDAIEIPLEEPEELDSAAARKLIESHGLSVTTCAAMGPGRDLIHPDKSVRESSIGYVKSSIDAAHDLGATVFAGPVYAEVGRLWHMTDEERESDMQLLVDQLSELSDYADERDVTICVEALNRFETSFLNLTSQVVDLVERVDHSRCKILVDLFHAGIEEKNLGDAIRTAGDDLYHVQVADNDRGTPGTGQFDWEEVAVALSEIGYDGNVIIETFSPDNQILAKAASIWRPLADSPDALAREGLAFLKELLVK